MAININSLFPVTPSVLNTSTSGLSFAGNFLTENVAVPNNSSQSTLQFFSADAVGAFFGLSSDEYLKVAIPYFKGFDNSSQKASYILFTHYNSAEINAYMQGGKVTATVAQFQAITTGSITFNVNNTAYAVTGINLSAATSYSNVASIVLADLISAHALFASATLTYNSQLKGFLFNTGLGTGTDTIAFCSNSALAALMGFQTYAPTLLSITSGSGYLSQGAAAQTPAEGLANLKLLTGNFATFTNVFDVSSDTTNAFALAASEWASNNNYAFIQWNSSTVANEITFNTSLVAEDYANVAPNYADLSIASFVCGIAPCINYNAANAAIAYAFKQQSGLAPIDISDEDAANMVQDHINFYGDYVSNSIAYPNTVNFYQQGRISGQFVFLQNFINQMWLSNAIQNALIVLFSNAKIVGYNPKGYSLISAAITGVMAQALVNGVVTVGSQFSQDQKAILINQAGLDISPFLTQSGYYVQVQPVTGDQQASNVPPPTTVWYTNGGVILTLPVNTVFIL